MLLGQAMGWAGTWQDKFATIILISSAHTVNKG
jgi:hypothetical protein